MRTEEGHIQGAQQEVNQVTKVIIVIIVLFVGVLETMVGLIARPMVLFAIYVGSGTILPGNVEALG